MTADLLVCWYILGWVACGVNFAAFSPKNRAPGFFCFVMPILIIAIGACCVLPEMIERNRSAQYLWRKP